MFIAKGRWGRAIKYQEQIKHNKVINPNWLEANQLAIYKRSWGVELGTTVKQL